MMTWASALTARAAKFATEGSMPSCRSETRLAALLATAASVVPMNQIRTAMASLMP
jgi:hypothetical protein